jgi:glyoxylate reductase
MLKPKVFLTRRILDIGLALINETCDATVWPDELPPSREELIRHVRGMDGLLSLLTDKIDDELMQVAGQQLKVISNCAVGVDNVDVPAATRRGIPVGNTPGILTDATADFTLALMLAASRRVVQGVCQVETGGWKTWSLDMLLGGDFSGMTLGIVGFGRIGQAVACRAAGFGMKILFSDPVQTAPRSDLNAHRVELEELLRTSDYISLHPPLTPETHHLIDATALAKMKSTAVLVNTSRGAVVDQDALVDALQAGRIFAAALDVTVPEPLPPDHPLLTLENCIVTPHIASASSRTRQNMSRMAAENLVAGVTGKPLPYCVNPSVISGKE